MKILLRKLLAYSIIIIIILTLELHFKSNGNDAQFMN